MVPKLLRFLGKKPVIQIACGDSHSLVLTDSHDVYSWGRVFEGQLGISENVTICTKPTYARHLFNNPIKYIAVGAFYSLAINENVCSNIGKIIWVKEKLD